MAAIASTLEFSLKRLNKSNAKTCETGSNEMLVKHPTWHTSDNSLPLYTMTEAKIKKMASPPLAAVYERHFDELYRYAFSMLRNRVQAEDVVQAVFLDIWQNNLHEGIHTSLRAFLFKSVYFKCLNEIKHNKVRDKFELHHLNHSTLQTRDEYEKTELRNSIEEAINALPAECKKVFELCKIQGLKYHEAAAQLQISPKTVENQMSKALKSLRQALLRFILPITTLIFYLP